jgi:CO/xanthine dehydrogenase Mo-binding subunit
VAGVLPEGQRNLAFGLYYAGYGVGWLIGSVATVCSMSNHASRPHTVQRVTLGASRDGRLAAIVHDGFQETSTYEDFTEALLNPTRFLHSCPNVHTRHRVAPMNVHTPTYMRAPGVVSGIFALESAMDELAVALNIDPIELRLRNEPERDEFKNLPFSSRSTRECYRAAAERFGWNRRNPQPRSMRDGRWLIGWGMATATYPMNYAPASAMARLLPDGTAEVTSASSDMGAGHLDLHDAGCSRDARPADRAGEIHSWRYPAAASARARRLDDHGKRRQRRAGGLP